MSRLDDTISTPRTRDVSGGVNVSVLASGGTTESADSETVCCEGSVCWERAERKDSSNTERLMHR